MNYKKLDPAKIRSRLVRKGFFTQLPINAKSLEGEYRTFRTILDHILFDATSDDLKDRKEAFKLMNPEKIYSVKGYNEAGQMVSVSNVQDFNVICSLAGLNEDKTRAMMLNFLDNFFPQVFVETSCSFRL